MGEPAYEMPVSQARAHFADIVNAAAYAGRITVITRRGKRIAAVAPPNWLAALKAEARETATATVCRAWWNSVSNADQATKDAVRATIDRIMEAAEDATAGTDPTRAGIDAGAPSIPAERVRAERELDRSDA